MAEAPTDDASHQPIHVSPVLDEFGNEPHFPSSKSVENMESILLENSQLDLDEDSEGEQDDVANDVDNATDALADDFGGISMDEAVTSTPAVNKPIPSNQLNEPSKVQPKQLAQYFGDADMGASGDFFDTLESLDTVPAMKKPITADMGQGDGATLKKSVSFAEEGLNLVLDETNEKSPTPDTDGSHGNEGKGQLEPNDGLESEMPTRKRTISASEEIPVAFETLSDIENKESKGGSLPATQSTKNLSKFFTKDGSEAGDEKNDDGSDFFDSFAASEGGQNPAPPVAHSISQDSSQPDSLSECFTGEIPPIPGSSPFHSHMPTRLPSGDDVFSASLRTSDEDRRYDAWIPSEHTQQVLAHVATCVPGSYIPEPDHVTMPGVVLDELLGDPVMDLLLRFGKQEEAGNRHVLCADSVPQSEDGLRQLISAECYRAAVDLSTTLLTDCGQGVKSLNSPTNNSPHTLQLWFVRFSLFIKLRLYAHADTECQAFGNLDKPDLFYEYYRDTYPGRRGSMVPFQMRVLHAVLPLYLGKTQESLDRFYYLHAITSKILENLRSGLAEDGSVIELCDDSRQSSKDLWKQREIQLLYSMVNCLLHIKDYGSALDILDKLLKMDDDHKPSLLCAIARTYLQVGDIVAAERYFTDAEKQPDYKIDKHTKSRLAMNRGFTALGHGSFKEAQEFFKEAMDADPNNTVAINNMAVCSLYNGKLKEALNTLENIVTSDPNKYLQEGILFNLCTLYELESSHAATKKMKLLNLVSQYKGNGFNTSCLKLA